MCFDYNSIRQYRELLANNFRAFEEHTAAPIAHVRKQAAERILGDATIGFPRKGSDGFAYTDLDAMFAPDMGLNINRLPIITDIDSIFQCSLPTISSLLGIIVNDTYRPTDRLTRLLPEGVTITVFSAADDRMAKIIRNHYGLSIAPDNTAVTLNTGLAQDGVLIHIDKGVHLEKPIQLLNILQNTVDPNGTPLPVLAVRRLLVVLEQEASASILICDHDHAADTPSASTRVNEIILAENASLDLYELEESTPTTSRFNHTFAQQGADSRLSIFSGLLTPAHTRNEYVLNLTAPNASSRLDGMAIVDGTRLADNCATVNHLSHHCTSNQTFKYLVGDDGRGSFEGLIKVHPHAVSTEAYQNNRNILASGSARMHTRPQLEIYCDDVKCSHGAATGQLDERALLYMRSRGIDLVEARSMLMNAFMSDVIDNISLQPLRDRLRHLVEMRLSGNQAQCQGCDMAHKR